MRWPVLHSAGPGVGHDLGPKHFRPRERALETELGRETFVASGTSWASQIFSRPDIRLVRVSGAVAQKDDEIDTAASDQRADLNRRPQNSKLRRTQQ